MPETMGFLMPCKMWNGKSPESSGWIFMNRLLASLVRLKDKILRQ